jgi:hypothetical protein
MHPVGTAPGMRLDFREITSPAMPVGMRLWGAIKRGHSFCIALEPNMGGKFDGWTGYSLSWRKLPRGAVNYVPQPFHTSLEEAKAACEKLVDKVVGVSQ